MIAVEHVSKRYQTRAGWRTVLKDINFTLQKRERNSAYSKAGSPCPKRGIHIVVNGGRR